MGGDYPLTGKPFSLAGIIADYEEEHAARVAVGADLPYDLRYAFDALAAAARRGQADAHDDERAATERHIAVVGEALERLAATRVGASEAARLTGYERSHVVRLIRAGKLYAERAGRDWLIPRCALDALPPRSASGRPRGATTTTV